MQPIYLNHLLIFVDRDTYRALSASGFLNEHFACSEERTTHDQATGMSWTGRYYYGRNTYFEFMNPDRTSWAPRDALAFGIEKEGGSQELAGRLERELKRDITLFKRKRRYLDQDIPWFWTVDIPRKDDARLISWVMEYDPEFLGRWAPDLPPRQSVPGQADVTRSGFLTRYRSAIGDDLPGRLFRDIASVTVALPPDEADLLAAELGVYGYVAGGTEGSGRAKTGDADLRKNDETGGEPASSRERTKFRGPGLEIVVERVPPADDDVGSGQVGSGQVGSGQVGSGHDRSGHDGSGQVGAAGGVGGITAFTMETRPVSVTTTHTFGPACRLTVESTGKAAWSFGPNYESAGPADAMT